MLSDVLLIVFAHPMWKVDVSDQILAVIRNSGILVDIISEIMSMWVGKKLGASDSSEKWVGLLFRVQCGRRKCFAEISSRNFPQESIWHFLFISVENVEIVFCGLWLLSAARGLLSDVLLIVFAHPMWKLHVSGQVLAMIRNSGILVVLISKIVRWKKNRTDTFQREFVHVFLCW